MNPPWIGSFEVLDADGNVRPNQGLPLTQQTETSFNVGATIRYLGDTGLDPSHDAAIRTLTVDEARRTDLASVPAALRWFVNSYGAHTPAALFHDDLITEPSPLTPVEADLYFRKQLAAVGVPIVQRSIMWSAVALRTRWVTNRLATLLWIALSLAGLVLFVLAAVGVDLPDWTGTRLLVLIVAGLAPLPASLLWGPQRRAALVAAIVAIWIIPAGAIALVATGVYELLERTVKLAGIS